jgi:aminoglycoside/choline kinase family phosphotransferase
MNIQTAIADFLRNSLKLPSETKIEIQPLKKRGSSRDFFRLNWNGVNSAIAVHYETERLENTYYADIAAFLHEINLPAPRLFGHDPEIRIIIMQDLGNTDLYSLKDASWKIRRKLYFKTLIAIDKLHAFPLQRFPSGRVRLMQAFDPDYYLWERDYFRDNFVKSLCKIRLEPAFAKELEGELAALAQRLSTGSRCLVHRDLQSQNVMISKEEPFLIDFQGMRFGSPFYDLGSLLCDPYVSFSEAEREELLSFYYQLSSRNLDWSSFQNVFWEASVQRLMQALGCYGFLGLTKDLRHYLEYVPMGLKNIVRAVKKAESLPRLSELCAQCEKRIADSPPDLRRK